jgi:predicted PurR-regulated permease PerM
VTQGIRFVVDTLQSDGMQGLIQELPGPLRAVGSALQEYLPRTVDLGETLTGQGGKAATAVGGVVAATGSALLQTAMVLIALFFFLVRGAECIEWLDTASPLRRGQTNELLLEVKRVGHSVVVSNFLTAGGQAVIALVGYFIARVPYPFFFFGITFVAALIPAVGGAAVCVLCAGILWLTGHPYWALFLVIWGLAVVGLVDNVLRPLIIKGRAELDGAVVFFSLIGGVLAFGTVGLVIGPLIVSLFLATLRIYHRDVARPRRPVGGESALRLSGHTAEAQAQAGVRAD